MPTLPPGLADVLKADMAIREMQQAGRSLERYSEEFVELSYRVSWSDPFLNNIFLTGLDDDLLALLVIPFAEDSSLEDIINQVLQVMGSNFRVGDAEQDLSGRHPEPVERGGSAPTRSKSAPHSAAKPHRRRKRRGRHHASPASSEPIQPDFEACSEPFPLSFQARSELDPSGLPEIREPVPPGLPEILEPAPSGLPEIREPVLSGLPEILEPVPPSLQEPPEPAKEENLLDSWVDWEEPCLLPLGSELPVCPATSTEVAPLPLALPLLEVTLWCVWAAHMSLEDPADESSC
ncbi:uncharacterized protein LOC130565724 [Triplophysa rosa]|uniref:uncharacterized protein LOC130565724 n=1 Tax=Triplophysa rosa TaxID=992332 RepID=UPI002545CFF5|nr:uncharacterized protein LOC130565724 [Triplophysa rosa]